MTTKNITASELASGMLLKEAVYNEFNRITRVSLGVATVTIELEDGRTQYYRRNFRLEVAS